MNRKHPRSPPRLEVGAIPHPLQRAWIRHLLDAFDYYNWIYLKETLRRPSFRLGASQSNLGEWNASRREITISVFHILEHPWESVRNTVRHEMAHQYATEILRDTSGRPHSRAFAEACRLLRCDPRPSAGAASLGAIENSAAPRDRILTRIRELLALGGSPNEHEAATAMRLARRELLKYNLSLEDFEGPRQYGIRHLGRCSARIQEYLYTLAALLEEHFFVCVLWMHSYDPHRNRPGRILEISGTPENLDVAEYVYSYILGVAERLWKEHKRRTPRGGGTKFQYLAGLLHGFSDKLSAQTVQLKEEYGLVWCGDKQLAAFYNHRHPRRHRFYTEGVTRGERFEAGRVDGKSIVIRRPITESRNRGRALPSP